MRVALILALLIAVVATIFAVQNPQSTTLNLGTYEITSTVALIIIVTFLVGVIVGILASLPGQIRSRRRLKRLERETGTGTTTSYGTTADPLGTRSGTTEY